MALLRQYSVIVLFSVKDKEGLTRRVGNIREEIVGPETCVIKDHHLDSVTIHHLSGDNTAFISECSFFK